MSVLKCFLLFVCIRDPPSHFYDPRGFTALVVYKGLEVGGCQSRLSVHSKAVHRNAPFCYQEVKQGILGHFDGVLEGKCHLISSGASVRCVIVGTFWPHFPSSFFFSGGSVTVCWLGEGGYTLRRRASVPLPMPHKHPLQRTLAVTIATSVAQVFAGAHTGWVGPLSMNAIGHTVMSPSHPHPPHPCEVQPLSASPSSRLALATTWRGPWVGVEASTRRTTSCKPWSTATDLVRVQMCSGFL